MALLHSNNIKIGSRMPTFELIGVDQVRYSADSLVKNKCVIVVMFICNHCPYVKAIEDRIITLQRTFQDKNVQLVGICSNDYTDYPDDAPQQLYKRWEEKNYGFPYLIDEDQSVARDFGAVCTPDIFVYDKNRVLFYHGRLDDNWQNPSEVKSRDLEDAIRLCLKGEKAPSSQISSMGCSIKWKKT